MHKAKELVLNHINEHCIFRCDPNKQYSPSLPPGRLEPRNPAQIKKPSSVIHLSRLFYDAKMGELIGPLFHDFLFDIIEDDWQLAGPETGSIPFGLLLQKYCIDAFGVYKNFFSIKKERKSYLLFNYIEGKPNEYPVLYIDDIISSGSSLRWAMRIVDEELDLLMYPAIFSMINRFGDGEIKIIAPYTNADLDFSYSEEKYWEPKDIQ